MQLFRILFQCTLFVSASLVFQFAWAGSISFSIGFTGDEIILNNTGTEAGYQFSLWTLDSSEKWQHLPIFAGNVAYLAPGKNLRGRRQVLPAVSALGRADPLLVIFHDQAGGRTAQLAWRQAPTAARSLLKTQHDSTSLKIAAGDKNIITTYGIVVPYDGIKRLTNRFSFGESPPDPLHHMWTDRAVMKLKTGAGLAGAWLIHESSAGDLQVQIVPDGRIRGQEQIPFWLLWVRQNLMTFAAIFFVFGAVLFVAGFIWPRHNHSQVNAKE